MYYFDNNNELWNQENLEKYAKEIKLGYREDKDKTYELKKIKKMLEEINTKSSLEEYFKNNKEVINFFINDFINDITFSILGQSYVEGNDGDDIALDILYQIYRLFEKFHDKNYSMLLEKIRQLTNEQNNFYHPSSTTDYKNEKKMYNLRQFFKNLGIAPPLNPLFKAGEKVDILVKHFSSQSEIDNNVWLRGEIKKIEKGRYYLDYNGENNEAIIQIGNSNIQRFGTKTIDWDWRTNLKKYDLIDVYARDKWWPATILEVVEDINRNGIKKVKYKIGLRLYTKHFNNPKNPNDSFSNYTSFWENNDVKLDENKEEFIGDGKDSDIELYHFSSRIQEFYSYSEIQKMSIEEKDEFIIENVKEELIKNVEKKNDSNLNDDYDLYEKSQNNLIKGKSDYFSYYYALLLKKIEDGEGFIRCLEFLKGKPSNEELFTIFAFLFNCFDYIIPNYFEENKEIFKNAFFEYINNLNDKEIKNPPNDLKELSSNFLKKVYQLSINDENIEEQILINFSFKLIKTTLFDKRLEGIKDLSNYLNSINSNEAAELRAIDLIKNNNIIKEIFGSNYHSQIISKSDGIVRILLKNHKLGEEEIKLIMGCAQKGDLETEITIINLMKNLIHDFDDNFIGLLMNFLLSNKDRASDEKEMNLVFNIASQVRSLDNKTKITQYFCNSLFNSNSYKFSANPGYKILNQLMNNDETYIKNVLEICENNIKNNNHSLICNAIIIQLIKTYITETPNENPPYICKKNCLIDYFKEEHLIKIFEENFSNYMSEARKEFASKSQKEIDMIIIDGENHNINVNGRLSFLKMLSRIYPNYNYISKIKELLLDNPSTPSDKNLFYDFTTQFFSIGKNKQYKNETREVMKRELFEIFINNDQTNLTFQQFKILLELFFNLNTSKLEYKVINENGDYEIKLKPDVSSEEIYGIDLLWKIIFQSEEVNIINKLINILYQIIPEEEILVNLEKEELEGKEKKYKLLKLFLIESEKNSIIDFKSHYSLLKNSIIKFPLEIKGEEYEENICEFFYDNTSLNDIKNELSNKYKIPMICIKAYYINNEKKLKLDYTYNNKTLKEIILDNLSKNDGKNNKNEFNKILSFSITFRKENFLISKKLSPKFKNILSEWFTKFSENTGKMDKKMFEIFLLSTNTNISNKELDERINLIFNKYGQKEKGYIIEEEFLKYYLDLLLEENKFDYCIENLYNMGYNEHLENKKESSNVSHIENENSFRFILSNNDEILNEFIKDYNDSNQKIDYNFLFFLSTNLNNYNYLLYKFNKDKKALDNLFEDKYKLLLLYYLIIIESFIQDIELQFIDYKNIFKNDLNFEQIFCSKKYEPFDNIDINEKNKFLEDFIKNGNYIKLVEYIAVKLNKFNGNIDDLLQECFLKSMKLIIIIYRACVGVKKIKDFPIDDNIYYLDYSHISNLLENKDNLKNIVLNYNYSNYIESLMDYLNTNVTESICNKCFDSLIDLLAFNKEINKCIIDDTKKKNNFISLIESIVISNNSYCINKIINTLKELSFKTSSIENEFIDFLGDMIISSFDNLMNNDKEKNLYYFFNFLNQIIDCLNNTNINVVNNLLENIIKTLINDIKEKNEIKKMPNEMFIKYMELIIKNPKIKDMITYKENKTLLYNEITEKLIDLLRPKELSYIGNNNYFNNDKYNKEILESMKSENLYVNLEKENEEDESNLNEQIKNVCLNYISLYLNGLNEKESLKGIISIKQRLMEIIKNDNQEGNYNNGANNRNQSLKVCGHVGLKNLGSTCYMNSVLQQLYMVQTLRYAVMGGEDKDFSLYPQRFSPTDGNLLHQLQVMFTYLTLSDKEYYNPEYFCRAFKDSNGNPINTKMQQDSQEFYNNFCDKIEEHLKKTKYKYIINDVLVGKTCSSIQCESCHHISNKFEDFYNLSLEVKNINNLNTSLEKLIEPEEIDDFKCDKCNKKVIIQKRTTLSKLPNILVIQLKRFFMNYDYGNTEKINSKFEFPLKLNLEKYCVEKFQKEDKKLYEIYSKNKDYYEYLLKGVVIHMGSAHGGHYISLIDVNREGNKNTMDILKKDGKSKWVKFNDSSLSEFDINDLSKECYGGKIKSNSGVIENSSNAYLLIYERIKKNPIKLVIEEKETINNKDCIEYTKEKENYYENKYDISRTDCETKEEELYKLIFHNKDNDEYYQYIPYYSVPKIAPKSVYEDIMSDNIIKKENKKKKEELIKKEIEEKFNNLLNLNFYSINSIEAINSLELNDKIDLINLIMIDIFKNAKKDNLSIEEKKEINKKMNFVIEKIIQPLVEKKEMDIVLKCIYNDLVDKDNFFLIFNLRKEQVFDHKNIGLIYDIIKNIFEDSNSQNDLFISMIFQNLIDYIKEFKTSPNYKGSDEENNIKYIYELFKHITSTLSNIEPKKKSFQENMVSVFLKGIEKECNENQEIIFEIVKMLLEESKDYYKESLSDFDPKEKEKYQDNELNDKEIIVKLMTYPIIQLMFEKDDDLLVILMKILSSYYIDLEDKFIYSYLPKLLSFSNENNLFNKYIDFCYKIFDWKDHDYIKRLEMILGYPTLIIRPITNSGDNNQKWPLFGAELIKYNNNDIKTEIYKYISFKKDFCILSYFLPCETELKEGKVKNPLNEDIKKGLVSKLISKCFSKEGNYELFKYLYLLPARSLFYKNAYEELLNIIKDKYNFNDMEIIQNFYLDKINYELANYTKKNSNSEEMQNLKKPDIPLIIKDSYRESSSTKYNNGFCPEIVPGEIIREEFEPLVKTKYLDLITIEYFTKYYTLDELKKYLNENKEKESLNNSYDKNINKEEKVDNKEKALKIDISNPTYHIEENDKISKINKRLNIVDKFIIEDNMIEEKNKGIYSLVRYIFINKKPLKNIIAAKLKINNSLKKSYPKYIQDYVDKHNYVDFFDIIRFKKDEKILQKSDIVMSIESQYYPENYN